MPYGRKLKDILDEKGISQAELSRMTGIEPSNISYIVNNDRNVREKTLARICEALKIDPREIMLKGRN